MIPAHKCFLFTAIVMKLYTKTSYESRMCPIYFGVKKVKGQDHNALITENGLCRIIAIPLQISSGNFTYRLPMRWGCALFILGSKGQRSRSQGMDYWKWKLVHNWFPFTPIIMKLRTQTPHEVKMYPIDFGVKRLKVKVTMLGLLKMEIGAYLLSLYAYHHETWYADSPLGEDVAYWFWSQKVKGQGHNALITENGNLRIIAFPLHLSSWNFLHRLPMRWRCTLLILGSKGQR